MSHDSQNTPSALLPGLRDAVIECEIAYIDSHPLHSLIRRLKARIARLEMECDQSKITPTAHTDHPLRHFDRTCPACVEEQNAAPINAATETGKQK